MWHGKNTQYFQVKLQITHKGIKYTEEAKILGKIESKSAKNKIIVLNGHKTNFLNHLTWIISS